MKQRGFTLIEMMIGLVIVGIVITMVTSIIASLNNNSTVTWGVNGMTEMRCINGYMFVISHNGQARQVIDEFGKGAKCN